jgi:polysulfide reductase-like protein
LTAAGFNIGLNRAAAVGVRGYKTRMPDEERLDHLREEAWNKGAVAGRGVDVAGGPIPRKPGYYGEPVLKSPVWTWQIPVYLFVGGLSGMAAAISLAAFVFRRGDVGITAMWVAAAGAIVSPILLTMDLGRPRLFLNMLRVFKYKSPMSVGAWIVFGFGACAIPGVIAIELHTLHLVSGGVDQLLKILSGILVVGSAFFGVLLATYTGVLLGATAIPAWFLHRVLLPIHFGTAGLGSAAALLELLGHHIAPLNAIGFLAAGIETALWIWLELNKHGAADRALHERSSGWFIRGGEVLSGPLALILRLTSLVPLAGICFLLGALISRFGWTTAGTVCACDPEAVFASQKL